MRVSVKSNRVPVVGLQANDFVLLDNGVPQRISDLSLEPAPLDISLVLDVDEIGLSNLSRSRSVLLPETATQQVRTDVQTLVRRLQPVDRLRIVKVGSESGEVVPLLSSPIVPVENLGRRPFLR